MSDLGERVLVRCRRAAYWHSENVTCYVRVDDCPACHQDHPVVVLYVDEDHNEVPPQDYLNGVNLPCGVRADLIYEYAIEQEAGDATIIRAEQQEW